MLNIRFRILHKIQRANIQAARQVMIPNKTKMCHTQVLHAKQVFVTGTFECVESKKTFKCASVPWMALFWSYYLGDTREQDGRSEHGQLKAFQLSNTYTTKAFHQIDLHIYRTTGN